MTTKTVTVMKNFSWLGPLGIIFVLCKIFEVGVVATWSWWIVLLPFYLVLLIVVAILFGGMAFAGSLFGCAAAIDAYDRHKSRKQRAAQMNQKWGQFNKKD